jgi:hypothetical protein
MKPPHLYPSNKVKIFRWLSCLKNFQNSITSHFRTAAPLARLTQPPLKNMNGARNFSVRPVNPKHRDIFLVTQSRGIVYVHDSGNLRNAPEYVRCARDRSTNPDLTRRFQTEYFLDRQQQHSEVWRDRCSRSERTHEDLRRSGQDSRLVFLFSIRYSWRMLEFDGLCSIDRRVCKCCEKVNKRFQ